MEIDIKPIDFRNATREEWNLYHKFRRSYREEDSPGDPVLSDEQEELWMDSYYDGFKVFSYYVTRKDDPSEIIAFLRSRYVTKDSPSYKGNEQILRNLLYVLKDYRRQGIGRELMKIVTKHAQENGKSLLMTGTSQEDGREVLKKMGGKEALEMRDNRANLDDIDFEMLETWLREGPARSPYSKLTFHTKIPDDILEIYCRVYTEVVNQAPLDDLEMGAQIITPEHWRKNEQRIEAGGGIWLTAMLHEENGDISGLTDVVYLPEHADMLYQQLTGVPENYRGQGKGKWLKAAMLLRVRDEFPGVKTIVTQNATSNEPMLAINDRLGFKLYRELYSCQVETERVVGYLKGK